MDTEKIITYLYDSPRAEGKSHSSLLANFEEVSIEFKRYFKCDKNAKSFFKIATEKLKENNFNDQDKSYISHADDLFEFLNKNNNSEEIAKVKKLAFYLVRRQLWCDDGPFAINYNNIGDKEANLATYLKHHHIGVGGKDTFTFYVAQPPEKDEQVIEKIKEIIE